MKIFLKALAVVAVFQGGFLSFANAAAAPTVAPCGNVRPTMPAVGDATPATFRLNLLSYLDLASLRLQKTGNVLPECVAELTTFSDDLRKRDDLLSAPTDAASRGELDASLAELQKTVETSLKNLKAAITAAPASSIREAKLAETAMETLGDSVTLLKLKVIKISGSEAASVAPAATDNGPIKVCGEVKPKVPATGDHYSKEFAKSLKDYLKASAVFFQNHPGKPDTCPAELDEVLTALEHRNDIVDARYADVGPADLLGAFNGLQDALAISAGALSTAVKAAADDSKASIQSSLDLVGADTDTVRVLIRRLRMIVDQTDARYAFYSGVVYHLAPDGDWKNGINALYRSESQEVRLFNFAPVRGFVSFEYFNRGGKKANTQPETTTDPTTSAAPMKAAAEGDQAETFVSPFDAEGGVVNVQTGISMIPQGSWLGASIRGGFESLPVDDDKSILSMMEPFYTIGFVTRQIYPDSALGQFFFGIGRDLRWRSEYIGSEHNQYSRFMMSGLLELAKFDNGASIATRIQGSIPISGKSDASELRLSILLGFDISKLRGLASAP